MKNKLLKMASLFITPILILFLLIATLNSGFLNSYVVNNKAESVVNLHRFKNNSFKFFKDKKNALFKKQDDSYACSSLKLNSEDIELVPGGESVGVRLSCKGILVVGFTEPNSSRSSIFSSDIHIGDMITEVNDEEVKTSKELISKVKNLDDDQVNLTILRNDEEKTETINLETLENGDKRMGLWVRDTTAGVGTMTFYRKDNNVFGALGHPVIDGDTNECFEISGGSLLRSSVISVRRGEKGNPGELKGIFVDDDSPIGSIETNTNCGIFGKCTSNDYKSHKSLKVASRDEIVEGPATIITTIDEEGPKEYDITIEKLYAQNEPGPKSMIIKITDKELLEKTGGIVQGMSGSPIIQNNKIVGAVTHVLINRPDTGYGIYIDWMLQETDTIK